MAAVVDADGRDGLLAFLPLDAAQPGYGRIGLEIWFARDERRITVSLLAEMQLPASAQGCILAKQGLADVGSGAFPVMEVFSTPGTGRSQGDAA